jgi:hypothetical protein
MKVVRIERIQANESRRWERYGEWYQAMGSPVGVKKRKLLEKAWVDWQAGAWVDILGQDDEEREVVAFCISYVRSTMDIKYESRIRVRRRRNEGRWAPYLRWFEAMGAPTAHGKRKLLEKARREWDQMSLCIRAERDEMDRSKKKTVERTRRKNASRPVPYLRWYAAMGSPSGDRKRKLLEQAWESWQMGTWVDTLGHDKREREEVAIGIREVRDARDTVQASGKKVRERKSSGRSVPYLRWYGAMGSPTRKAKRELLERARQSWEQGTWVDVLGQGEDHAVMFGIRSARDWADTQKIASRKYKVKEQEEKDRKAGKSDLMGGERKK